MIPLDPPAPAPAPAPAPIDTRPLMEKIFGANWRTTVGGIGATTGAILLGLLTLKPEVWQNPKYWVPSVIIIVLKTYGDINAKDAQVTGNGAANTPQQVAESDGTNRTV